MLRHPDQLRMIGKIPADSLPDPLGSIGGKPVIQGIVKFSCGSQQSDASLLNKIQKRNPPSRVFPCHGYHKPQVGTNHLTDGVLISFGAAPGKLPFFLLA